MPDQRRDFRFAIAVAEVIAARIGYGFEDETGTDLPTGAMRAIDLSENAVAAITGEAKTKIGDLT